MAKYIVRDTKQLDIDFYKGFHFSFIYNKALTLWSVLENRAKFFEIAEMQVENEIELKKYIESLNAEIYFSELHQTEVLFALMLAPLQELPHWLYLTTYKTKEIKEAIEGFLNGTFAKKHLKEPSKLQEFIAFAIYSNYKPSDVEKIKKWDENIDNIIWLLQRLGKRYLEANEYNAYKHGLRVYTSESAFFVSPDGVPDGKTCLGHSKDSLTYLELKDKGEGGQTVMITTKHFNPLESLNYLAFMANLLETIKETRLARLSGGKEKVKLNLFSEIDRNELLQLSKSFTFSITA